MGVGVLRLLRSTEDVDLDTLRETCFCRSPRKKCRAQAKASGSTLLMSCAIEYTVMQD